MSDAGLISAEKMRALTGLSDKQLRAIADKGYFPPAQRGQYNSSAVVYGLFKYYREQAEPAPNEIYFDSIASAAGQMDVPVGALKAAKKRGCPAFKGSRVYLLPLVKWLAGKRGDDDAEDWYQEKAKAQTLRERVKLQHDLKQAADWDDVAFGINRGMALIFSQLEKLFSQTLPPELKNLAELEIKRRLNAHLEPLIANLRTELGKLGELDSSKKEDG